MYVRKDNYLTYNGESYKLIDDENKSITWKDGSKSPLRSTNNLVLIVWNLISYLECLEACLYVLFVEWKIKRKYKRKNRLNEASNKEKY